MKKHIFLLLITALFGKIVFAQKIIPDDFPVRYKISADSLLTKLKTYNTLQEVDLINPMFLPLASEIENNVKQKIISLLKREWPDSVIKYKVEQASKGFKNRFNGLIWDKRLNLVDTFFKVAMEKNLYFDSALHYVYENMLIQYKNDIEKRIRETPVPDEIVLTAAALKIKEATPIIKNDLASGRHFMNTAAAELAMAGLGDVALQKKYFARHKQIVAKENHFKDFVALAYIINTQESVALLADWLDTTEHHFNNYGEGIDSNHTVYKGGFLMPQILGFINNKSLKEGYIKQPRNYGSYHTPKNPPSWYNTDYISPQEILFVRDWLIANKGKYEFD